MSDEVFRGEAIAENRKYPRIKMKLLVQYLTVNKSDAHIIDSVSRDIGLGGLALTGRERLHVGQLLMITIFIPLPENRIQDKEVTICTEDGCTSVNALSRVAWCQSADNRIHTMGIQFLHLVIEDRDKLKEFARDFHLITS